MKKGFMFSIEALLCIIAVGTLLAASAYYVTAKEAPLDSKLMEAQSAQMTAFYFNEEETGSSEAENLYCKEIASYDFFGTKAILTKKICR